MRNDVDLMQLDATVNHFSCKDMKKQSSMRFFRRLGSFGVVAELLNALRILWEAFLPFALLWWNALLCACCAKYYSWNRSRFRLEWAGRRVFCEAMASSDVKKSLCPGNERRCASNAEMKGLMHNDCSLHSLTACGPAMALEWLPERSELPLQASEIDHAPRKDAGAVNGVMDRSVVPDDTFKAFESESSIVSHSNASKFIESPLCDTSKLLFHVFDGNIAQQLVLLKSDRWADLACLIPLEAAPLSKHGPASGAGKLLERFWLCLNYCSTLNSMERNAALQLLPDFCIKLPPLEEYLVVSVMFCFLNSSAARKWKKHVCLSRQTYRLLMNKIGLQDASISRLGLSSCPKDFDFRRNGLSLETLRGSMKCLSFDVSSFSHTLDLKLGKSLHQTINAVSWTLDHEEDRVCENGSSDLTTLSQSSDECNCNDDGNVHVNDNQVKDQNSEISFESRPLAVSNSFLSTSLHSNFEDESGDDGKEMGASSEFLVEDNGYQFFDNPGYWDANHGCLDELEEEEGAGAGHYYAHGDFERDEAYFRGSLENEDGAWDGLSHDNAINTDLWPVTETDLSINTWWDKDAVLVGEQGQDEVIVDQTWQMV